MARRTAKIKDVDPLAAELRAAFASFKRPRRRKRAVDISRADGIHPLDLIGPAAAPWDWRNRISISPPLSQLPCNSCTAFAVATSIEASALIRHNTNIRVDPGFLHTCIGHAGESDPAAICITGVELHDTLEVLHIRGFAALPAAPIYPFPPSACAGRPTSPIAGFTLLNGPVAAQQAIIQVGPIAAEMFIWNDFFNYRGLTPVYMPTPSTGGMQIHTICIVGFNEVGWIIKNSMGSGWGIGGYATIAYGSCGLIAPPPPGIAIWLKAYALWV